MSGAHNGGTKVSTNDVGAGLKPNGWPDKCHNCGAHWSHIGFDYADGFNCRKCGASDADE